MRSDATRWSLRRNPGNAMDHQVLEEIAKTLNADVCNYTVFLRYFEMPLQKPARKEILIKTVLGADATLGGIREVEKSIRLAQSERCAALRGRKWCWSSGFYDAIRKVACLDAGSRRRVSQSCRCRKQH